MGKASFVVRTTSGLATLFAGMAADDFVPRSWDKLDFRTGIMNLPRSLRFVVE